MIIAEAVSLIIDALGWLMLALLLGGVASFFVRRMRGGQTGEGRDPLAQQSLQRFRDTGRVRENGTSDAAKMSEFPWVTAVGVLFAVISPLYATTFLIWYRLGQLAGADQTAAANEKTIARVEERVESIKEDIAPIHRGVDDLHDDHADIERTRRGERVAQVDQDPDRDSGE